MHHTRYSLLNPDSLIHSNILPLGLRAAQVRVIFRLREYFNYPHPLAYVHWYTPFRHPDPDTGFFTVTNSTRAHVQSASVIPISDIAHTCHLIPVFGNSSARELGWTAGLVLQQAQSFYLNPYLRHYDFYYLRYRVDTRDSCTART